MAPERCHIAMATSSRHFKCSRASRPDVTSGITCEVTGSRKQGVQASRELSGCSRAERLEAVATLCSHCLASCSSRVSAPAGSSNFRPGLGVRGRRSVFRFRWGGLRKAPIPRLDVQAVGRGGQRVLLCSPPT